MLLSKASYRLCLKTISKEDFILNTSPRIILASASARRKEILTHLGLNPEIAVSNADEELDPSTPPRLYTEELSLRKAKAVKPSFSDSCLIIASDTVVCADGKILGKPTSNEDAFSMLSLLSGSTHSVISGIAVLYDGKVSVASEVTEVTFRAIPEREIYDYINTGEPFDKAGAYGIQDIASVFVEKINGDYFNVVGLPVFRLFELLKRDFGLDYFRLCGK